MPTPYPPRDNRPNRRDTPTWSDVKLGCEVTEKIADLIPAGSYVYRMNDDEVRAYRVSSVCRAATPVAALAGCEPYNSTTLTALIAERDKRPLRLLTYPGGVLGGTRLDLLPVGSVVTDSQGDLWTRVELTYAGSPLRGWAYTYDTDRDGFLLGEGGAILVLESEEHARARNADIICTLAGYGVSADSHHIAAPEPEGAGASRAMADAVRDAGATAADLSHINAHATSTPVGDVAEVAAIRKAFGSDADHMAVSGTKSMTGHLLGAAGALEAVFSALAIRDRVAPPTINIENLDPEVDLDIVRDEPRRLAQEGDLLVLDNSFGFGGHNVALAFGNH